MGNKKVLAEAQRRTQPLALSGEIEIPCISEENLEQEMEQLVEPYLADYQECGYYQGLYYELYPSPEAKGTVVWSYGFTESCEKYHEMIYYFHKAGYQAAILDHRGHGKSQRLVDNPYVIHIPKFSQYVEDLHNFVQDLVKPMVNGKPLYLYAHSMGGCIGALYLERYPKDFAKAVLNAPMLGIQLGNLPLWAAQLFCGLCILFGKKEKRIFFMEEFKEEEPFEMSGTSSRARHAFYRKLQREHQEYQTCCCTYQWVYTAIQGGRLARRTKNRKRVEVPVVVFQALEDAFVTAKEQKLFVGGIAQGQLVTAPTRHEIGRGPNEIMEPYLAYVWDFFQ